MSSKVSEIDIVIVRCITKQNKLIFNSESDCKVHVRGMIRGETPGATGR